MNAITVELASSMYVYWFVVQARTPALALPYAFLLNVLTANKNCCINYLSSLRMPES